MMRKTMIKLVLATALGGMLNIASAGDVLLIQKVEERMMRDLPGNGLTMGQVEQRYGQPVERRAAVGDPPITRWTYDHFNVYFEHDRVIDSVLHHQAVAQETGTSSES